MFSNYYLFIKDFFFLNAYFTMGVLFLYFFLLIYYLLGNSLSLRICILCEYEMLGRNFFYHIMFLNTDSIYRYWMRKLSKMVSTYELMCIKHFQFLRGRVCVEDTF